MSTQASVATPYYNPRLVSCPTCNAPKGKECIALIVAPGCGPHLERYYKARAYMNHPSNNPVARHGREASGTNMLNGAHGPDCKWCAAMIMTPRVPRVSSCAPGCTLNSNHQGDCND